VQTVQQNITSYARQSYARETIQMNGLYKSKYLVPVYVTVHSELDFVIKLFSVLIPIQAKISGSN